VKERNSVLDERRWKELLGRLCGKVCSGKSFQRIVAAYSEPQRSYHTGDHIEACLAEFDRIRELCESPDQVECALWLHDVVYDPRASDNEEKSALWAMEILSESGCPERVANHVWELILITKHKEPPVNMDARLMVDIDLAILGRPSTVFDVYEKSIRAEYSWVPEESYRTGRSKVLLGFLQRPAIFFTERFEEIYGMQARENLENSVLALEWPKQAGTEQAPDEVIP
jgi:predicted metal-dependent HD superfamily phosphohydrolase